MAPVSHAKQNCCPGRTTLIRGVERLILKQVFRGAAISRRLQLAEALLQDLTDASGALTLERVVRRR